MSVVTSTRHGAVLHAALHAPPANPLDHALLAGLSSVLDELEESDAKVLVLSSATPGIFIAGADIKLMSTLDGAGMGEYIRQARRPLERLENCGRVTIAAIDGFALGGGLELALACSLRFVTPSAKLGLPEVKLGLIPGAGGTQRLPRLVGRGRALELMLSGRSITGSEAAAVGLAERLVDSDVTSFALDYAQQVATFPRTALDALLTCANAADDPRADGFDVEFRQIVRMIAEGEGPEGIRAFLEKRAPLFA
jgi:enoyl-CoA hydratase